MAVNIKQLNKNSKELQKQFEIIKQINKINEDKYECSGKKKLAKVITYGCQQNENDSERLRGMLSKMGFDFTDDNKKADLILFNTCCVRENAELKVFGNVGALKHIKAKRPDMLIGICGCMMQQEHIVKKLKQKYKHVDMIFGTHTVYKFPEILKKAIKEQHTVIDVLDADGCVVEDVPIHRDSKVTAWISIMYGCNNFCSYCIVPYVRGRERSRKPEDIIKEIREAASEGYKEITLLGQNVNSYGKTLDEPIDFADLLKMVNEIEGIERIRFFTSHPKDISDKLIKTMSECEKICPQLHLPFQAGSNKVLKLMNRRYTKEKYLEIIDKVKAAVPNIALSSDVIVGFPGETNEDFSETLDVIKKVEFDMIFSFIYSKRKGTPAAKMEDVLTEKEKHANFEKLLDLQEGISIKKNENYAGKTIEVLVEGHSKKDDGVLTGRTGTGKLVHFEGNDRLIGSIINVKITEVSRLWLRGQIVSK